MRCLLHISKLGEFKSWLDSQGIEHRPGRGNYQVLQVRAADGKGWDCVYERNHMPKHFTTTWPMDRLVNRFIQESRESRNKVQ